MWSSLQSSARFDGFVSEVSDGRLSLEETQVRLALLARDVVKEAEFTSLTLWLPDRQRFETRGSTGSVATQLDLLQYELREGPCHEVLTHDAALVATPDLREDCRWPDFSRKASDMGVASLLSIRMSGGHAPVSLNLYSSRTGAFKEPLDDARLVARCGGLVLGHARQMASMTRALASRTLIGQAVGIVMERYGIDDRHAFNFLSRLSQDSNVKLRDLAACVVERSKQSGGRAEAEPGKPKSATSKGIRRT
jgi:hypothetical protein